MKVLVLGKHGQLASELHVVSPQYPVELEFLSAAECDIRDRLQVERTIKKSMPDAIIICSAYTAVDDAEDHKDEAYAINEEGVRNVDEIASSLDIRYIHISTDYVFDGEKRTPYDVDDQTNPKGVYGRSKLAGEQIIVKSKADCIVIRTAWLYSSFGKNFLKTMLHLSTTRDEINVVNDQVGCPTYTQDLAHACLKILSENQRLSTNGRIYHFANTGEVSWFEFAVEIFRQKKISCKVNPIPALQYPTKAKRPKYSVLSTRKIESDFHIECRDWKEALSECLELL